MMGADGRTPELRPLEFKGMMRWWWRAIKAEDDIETLRKEEAEIFGGTKKGQGKSKVKIRIKSNLEDGDIIEYQPLPHHKSGRAFRLKAIKPEKELEIVFDLFSENLEYLKYLIYLMFILGGFGRRSRRGFGSIQIIEAKIETNLNKTDHPKIEKIEINLDNILSFLKVLNSFYEKIDEKTIKNNKSAKGAYPWIKK